MKLLRAWRALMSLSDEPMKLDGDIESHYIKCGPHDVILVTAPDHISAEGTERIQRHFKRTWPNNDIIVIADSLQVRVVQRDLASAVAARLIQANDHP